MYNQTLNLNLISSGVPPVIHVSQYDNQINALTFKIYNGTTPFTIPNNAAVLINGVKPDKNVFSFAAASYSGNTVICNCEQQMTALSGIVVCELRIRTASEIIGTCNFVLQVEDAPLHDDSVISETMIPLIEQAVDIAANLAEYIQQTLDASRDAVDAAEAAALSASEASVYNSNVEQMYDSLEDVKTAANTAAAAANTAAATLNNLSATATTLAPGASATASYNSSTGVITFGIPRGATGESGIQTQISGLFAMSVDADGGLWAHCNSDELTAANFRYDTDTGALYYVIPEEEEEENNG